VSYTRTAIGVAVGSVWTDRVIPKVSAQVGAAQVGVGQVGVAQIAEGQVRIETSRSAIRGRRKTDDRATVIRLLVTTDALGDRAVVADALGDRALIIADALVDRALITVDALVDCALVSLSRAES